MRGFVDHSFQTRVLAVAVVGILAAIAVPNMSKVRAKQLAPRSLERVRAAHTEDGATLEEAIVAVEASRGVAGAHVAWSPDLEGSNGLAGRVRVEARVTDAKGGDRDTFAWSVEGERVTPADEATSDLLYRHHLLKLEKR